MGGENLLLTGAAAAIGNLALPGPLGMIGGALVGQQLGVSREQSKLDRATIEYNRQQAKLAAAEKSLSNARGFRKALANQMALANFRGGPGSSIATQFGSESMASFLEDQRAIQRGAQAIDTSATLQRAEAGMGRKARDVGALGRFGSSVLGATNLSTSIPKQGGS